MSQSIRLLCSTLDRAAAGQCWRFGAAIVKFNVKYLKSPLTAENYKDTRTIVGAGMFDVYGDLLDQADNCGAPRRYRDLIRRAANRKMAAEGVKWGMKLAGYC